MELDTQAGGAERGQNIRIQEQDPENLGSEGRADRCGERGTGAVAPGQLVDGASLLWAGGKHEKDALGQPTHPTAPTRGPERASAPEASLGARGREVGQSAGPEESTAYKAHSKEAAGGQEAVKVVGRGLRAGKGGAAGQGRRRRGRGCTLSRGVGRGMERWHSLCILHAFFHTISSTS